MGQACDWVMIVSDTWCSENDKTTKTKTRRKELRGTIRHASTLFFQLLCSGNRKVCKRGVLGWDCFLLLTMEALEPCFL